MGLTNETDQIRTVDQPCDGGAWRVSTFRRRPRKCNGCVQPRRLPLCSTVGAECHHAVEVDTVGLGFYGSQPVPGVYEREASATHRGTRNSLPPVVPTQRPRQACCATPVQNRKSWKTAAFAQFQFFDPTATPFKFPL